MPDNSSYGRWQVSSQQIFWNTTGYFPSVTSTSSQVVRVLASGICGSDIAKLKVSPYQIPSGEWWTPGHEIVVQDQEGNLAAVDPLIPCQACQPCQRGAIHLCESLLRIGWDLPGGFASHLEVPTDNLVPIGPEQKATAVLADIVAVAVHALRCSAGKSTRGNLAIVGTGPLAVATAAIAQSLGWHKISIIGHNRRRLDSIAPLADTSLGLTGGFPAGTYDQVIDAASGDSSAPLDEALRIVRPGGRVIVLNAYRPRQLLATPLRSIFSRSITLTGAYSYCRQHDDGDFFLALRLLHSNPPWAKGLVQHQLPMSELQQAIKSHGDGTRIKTILTNEVNT